VNAANELAATSLPDATARARFDALFDLDRVKSSLSTAIGVALRPEKLRAWVTKHGGATAAQMIANRAPLFILGGDVGTGKTELAETIGDAVGRAERMEILLYRLSLTARGSGLVGEMTQRLSTAFATVLSEAKTWKNNGARKTGAILFIDEADAVAQSRAADQMHHEDRAGVNALVRSIDDLARAQVPVVVIMATNRLDALDPAIRRRAANVYDFQRPNNAQRANLFEKMLPDVKLSEAELSELVDATGRGQHGYGFSYSDIVQRLIPDALLTAFADDRPLDAQTVLRAARGMQATPPFN
jgi:AAA+ superfamily predicted ATPase